MKRKIKVMVIDDSALVRQSMLEIMKNHPQIEIIATAGDPFIAAQKLKKEIPDVITLDIEMPRMDGITFLKKLMEQHPIPVLICSTLAQENAEITLQALDLGAIDIIQKPKIGTKKFFEESKILISDAIIAAADTKVTKHSNIQTFNKEISPKLSADAIISKPNTTAMVQTTEKVVVVGASTGGTEALNTFLTALPYDSPGIVIVQHMPEHFTTAFAKRLNSLSKITVKEAQNNDSVLRGQALIAPGNYHLLLKRSGARYFVEVKSGPLVSRHRPSVDVLFRSAARYSGKNTIGVIMTGMGDDGAKGMLELKEAGAYNIAQDEKSCIVFGMPKEAIKLNAVHKVETLNKIAPLILQLGKS